MIRKIFTGLNSKNCFRWSTVAASSASIGIRSFGDEAKGQWIFPPDCLKRMMKAVINYSPAVIKLNLAEGETFESSVRIGTIINKDGTVLTFASFLGESQEDISTNEQILKALNQDKVNVTLKDGQCLEGMVVHADFPSDIAVLKLNSSKPLPAVRVGSSSKLCLGEWIFSVFRDAEGCPIRSFDCSTTNKGLGGICRNHFHIDYTTKTKWRKTFFMNLDGELVGLHIMDKCVADEKSIGVPIDPIKYFLEQSKKLRREIQVDSDPNENESLEFLANCDQLVSDGDVVVEIEGRPIAKIMKMIDMLRDKIGKHLTVTEILRDNTGKLLKVKVKSLENQPEVQVIH